MQRKRYAANSDFDEGCNLREEELAHRWRISIRTLQRWRQIGRGPAFLRLGRRIVYRLYDVEQFEEAAQVRAPDGL